MQLKKWCHLYQDRDTDEVIKVKGDTDSESRDISPEDKQHVKDHGFYQEVRIFGARNHPSLVNRRLRYLGLGTVCVTGFEESRTVPEFSYARTEELSAPHVN